MHCGPSPGCGTTGREKPLIARHTVEHAQIGPVRVYRVDLFTREGELAKMNKGEYCMETRVLVAAPDHYLLAEDNEAISTSTIIPDVEAQRLGFDPQNPDSEATIRAIGEAMAEDAEMEYSDFGPPDWGESTC